MRSGLNALAVASVHLLMATGWAGCAVAQQAQPASSPPLPWAYPVNPPAPAAGGTAPTAAPAADTPRSLPGSSRSFTLAQVRDGFNVADWRPDLHPAMPTVVSHGRAPDVRGCGFCHYPNGQGRPENSGLAGLPAAYIIQQMKDFQNDLRQSAEPRMGPPRAMITVAKGATDEEIRISAEYFASFEFRPWIRVVETNTVPRTVVSAGMFVPVPQGGTEPIGSRVVEVPEEVARTEIRDPASGFVAYVPVGSIARGRELTLQCALCHGADFRGLGPVPALAGRSPSYNARQLYDFQSGARRGEWSGLMKGAVETLTPDDIVAIVAYLGSLQP